MDNVTKMNHSKLTRRAYGKVNLGLDVIRKRPDGYHEVKMIMQMVTVYDELTFEIKEKEGISISVNKSELPIDENNLVYKAAQKFLSHINSNQGICIELTKNIPIAAGMAGGSTDAAATLLGLNELLDAEVSEEEILKIAVTIGADVPYCVMGGTALCEGIGEIMTPLISPPKCGILIAKPDISVSTKYVYENLHADKLKFHPDIDGMVISLKNKDLEGITNRMQNVLETVTIEKYPIIGEIKTAMLDTGAMNALMSGSGPTVFGIYKTLESAAKAKEKLIELGIAKDIFTAEFV